MATEAAGRGTFPNHAGAAAGSRFALAASTMASAASSHTATTV